jgi:hypothetical protein
MVWKRTLWIGLAALAGGCSVAADTKLADRAESQFYDQVAAKQYLAIYQAAAPEFRSAMPQDTFIGMMNRIDRKMGACRPPVKLQDWHFNASPGGDLQTQGYSRACANGALNEHVTVVIRGGQAQIAGYYAANPLLVTD